MISCLNLHDSFALVFYTIYHVINNSCMHHTKPKELLGSMLELFIEHERLTVSYLCECLKISSSTVIRYIEILENSL
jgi:predicted transcriptional regulator YheO